MCYHLTTVTDLNTAVINEIIQQKKESVSGRLIVRVGKRKGGKLSGAEKDGREIVRDGTLLI